MPALCEMYDDDLNLISGKNTLANAGKNIIAAGSSKL